MKGSTSSSEMKDLIDVSNEFFWSFKKRKFTRGVLNDSNVGHLSPHARIIYDTGQDDVDAGYFAGILQNSLSPEEIGMFCEDFLQLFERRRHHKQKVGVLLVLPTAAKCPSSWPQFQ